MNERREMTIWKYLGSLTRLILIPAMLFAASMGYAKDVTTAPVNLIELHAHAESATNNDCLACHASITTEVSDSKACLKQDAQTLKRCKKYHRVHLESKLSTPKECADCHKSVDLRNGSAGALRRQVDPDRCDDCHSGTRKGAAVLYQQ